MKRSSNPDFAAQDQSSKKDTGREGSRKEHPYGSKNSKIAPDLADKHGSTIMTDDDGERSNLNLLKGIELANQGSKMEKEGGSNAGPTIDQGKTDESLQTDESYSENDNLPKNIMLAGKNNQPSKQSAEVKIGRANTSGGIGKQKTKNYKEGKNQKLIGIQNHMKKSKLLALAKSVKKSETFIKDMAEGNDDGEREDPLSDRKLKQSKGGGMGFSTQIIKDSEEEESFNRRENFIEKYGVEINFPAFYAHSGVLVPHYKNFCISLGFHQIPTMDNQSVQITEWSDTAEGKVKNKNFSDMYYMRGESVIMKLYETVPREGFKVHWEIQLAKIRKIKVAFSDSGQFFGIYLQNKKILNIFDSRNLNKLYEDINNQESIMHIEVDEDFGYGDRLLFDQEDKYVVIASSTNVRAYSLQQQDFGALRVTKRVDPEIYEKICDMQVTSKGMKDNFKLFVACQCKAVLNVHIFDLNQEDSVFTIAHSKQSDHLKVKISKDCKSAILSNGLEHYIHDGKSQSNFPQIKDKFVRGAVSLDNGFYLACAKEYDRDIDILHSKDEKFNASIDKFLEPGLFEVFDMKICIEKDDHGHDVRFLKLLSRVGDYLSMSVIDCDQAHQCGANSESEDDDGDLALIGTFEDKHYRAYAFNWPYFSYSTKLKRTFILNAFNPNFVQCYEYPDRVNFISHGFLTDTHDYFSITETKDRNFEIFHIDLDDPNPRLRSVCSYPFSEVDDKEVTSFHCRGSSHKEKINLNKLLVIYILHGTILKGWVQGNEKPQEVAKDAVVKNLYYMSDDIVFYMTTQKRIDLLTGNKIEHSRVYMLETMFGGFRNIEVYHDVDNRAEILNFGVDNTRKRLIVLTGIKNAKNRRDKFVTLYDLETEKVLYQIQVHQREVIGRLKSNLYNFVEGHIYYLNKVIKIRYDLIDMHEKNGRPITEAELFDHYSDVLEIGQNGIVQSGCPFQTCLYNRLAYVIRNRVDIKARKLLIMPYLHERRIYLNRRHDHDQFYSIIKHQNEPYIMSFCWDLQKIYIYSETGRLVDRILYKDNHWGKPVTLSEDAKYVLFRPSDRKSQFNLCQVDIEGLHKIRTIDVKERLQSFLSRAKPETQEYLKMTMTYYEKILKRMDDMKLVKISTALNDSGDLLFRLSPTRDWLKEINSKKKDRDEKKEMFDLVDDYDEEEDDQGVKESLENCSFFFYIPGDTNISNGEYLYFDSPIDSLYDLRGVSMNTRYIFLWNEGHAWKIDLETKVRTQLTINISMNEKQTKILKVRTGSNQDIICFRVQQTPHLHSIIMWDLTKDLEIQQFDVDENAIFFQDERGMPYLAEKDYVVMCEKGCKLKCYHFKIDDFEPAKFDFGYGQRVEVNTHNWMIFRNFINLSFSYMTFVIKDLFDEGYLRSDFLFDLEGYDFIYNKDTIFTSEEKLVSLDYEKLSYILTNYEQADPILLEALHYSSETGEGEDKKIQLPLEISIQSKNHRMVNLILKYMTDINYACVTQISGIFDDLLIYNDFVEYLVECPFDTHQMRNKQTLKIREQEDDDIIATAPHTSSYVDGDFFAEYMKEDTQNKSFLTFPVKMQAVRADWILDSERPEGLEFLRSLCSQRNNELFHTPYIKIIIQFLYSRFRVAIIQRKLPYYVVHVISVILQIYFNNLNRANVQEEHFQDKQNSILVAKTLLSGGKYKVEVKPEDSIQIHYIFQIIALIVTIINLFDFTQQSIYLGLDILTRFWSYLELTSIILNLIVCFTVFTGPPPADNFDGKHTGMTTQDYRVCEALLILIMLIRSLYFMRLNQEIAPLVGIIVQIIDDIKYFAIIYIFMTIALILAFNNIGLNQRDIICHGAEVNNQGILKESKSLKLAKADERWKVCDDSESMPPYITILGAFDHVYTSSLGELSTDTYYQDSQSFWCIFLFMFMSLFMTIHLLNMLIAMMGESFSANHENGEAKKKQAQVQFVVDNWYIDPIDNKDKIVYIIAASHLEGHDEVNEDLIKIENDIHSVKVQQENMIRELQRLSQNVIQMQTMSQQNQGSGGNDSLQNSRLLSAESKKKKQKKAAV